MWVVLMKTIYLVAYYQFGKEKPQYAGSYRFILHAEKKLEELLRVPGIVEAEILAVPFFGAVSRK